MKITHNPDAHPIALDLHLLSTLGAEYYTWEPETIISEMARAHHGKEVPLQNRHKVNAILAIRLTDLPTRDWVAFEKVVAAFNGEIPDFEILQQLTIGQLVMGVEVISRLRLDKSLTFSPEVASYCAATALAEGAVVLPAQLAFALEPMADHCKRSGSYGLFKRCSGVSKGVTPPGDEDAAEQASILHNALKYLNSTTEALLAQLDEVYK